MAARESRPVTSKLGVGVALLAAVVGVAVFAGVRFLFFGLDDATPWDKPARLVDSQVEISYQGRDCRDRVVVDVDERPAAVVITVTETKRLLVCGADEDPRSYDVSVDLDAPLGERDLVDGACELSEFEQDARCASGLATVVR